MHSVAAHQSVVADGSLAVVAPPGCQRLLALSERDPRRAARLAHRAYERCVNTDASAWASFTLGYTLVRWERPAEASPFLQAALASFQSLGLAVPALHTRRCLLAAALILGKGAELQLQWDELALDYEALGLSLDACRARFDQAGHLNSLGRPRDALKLIELVAPLVAAKGTPSDHARLSRLSAVACRLCGLFEQGDAAIGRSISHYQTTGLLPELAKSLFERAIIHHRRDAYAPALADLREARAIFARLAMPLWEAYCAMDGGLVAARLGRYDEAIAATCEARARLEQLERWDHVSSCDLNLGNISYYCGLFDLALLAYRRAEHMFRILDRPRMVLICRRNQALALHEQGKHEQALALLNELRMRAAELDERVELAEIALAQGLALRALGRNAVCHERLDQAERLFDALGNAPMAAVCRLEKGWLQFEQGEHGAAAACFEASIAALAAKPIYRWRAIYGAGRCFEHQGDNNEALQQYEEAGKIIADLRQRLRNEYASSGLFRQAQDLLGSTLQLALRCHAPEVALQAVERLYAVTLTNSVYRSSFVVPPLLQHEFAQRQADLRRLIDGSPATDEYDLAIQAYIELLLRARHLRPALDAAPPEPVDLALLRARCNTLFPAGWTLLAYVQHADDGLIVIVVDAERAAMETIQLDKTLHSALRQATSATSLRYTFLDLPYLNGSSSRPWQALERLGDALIPRSVHQRLTREHRLLIVPSGPLQHLAWPALRIDDCWLVERAVVQLLPNLRTWLTLLDRPARGTEAAALLLGVSEFNGETPDLPNAAPSLDLVARIWPGPVHRVENKQLSRHWIFSEAGQMLRSASLIHIATHGQLTAAKGVLAHLKLGSEYLFHDDIAQLQLGGALVVLAACEGALGEILPGEEVISLSRAFLAAGARDVIASNWPIYDNGVLPLLEPLYHELVAGVDAPTALARAQRKLIARGQHDAVENILSSPLIWAGFVALGTGVAAEWQRVVPAPLHSGS